ncbi:hypothetical protein ES702_05370 [subsurface metagenome]
MKQQNILAKGDFSITFPNILQNLNIILWLSISLLTGDLKGEIPIPVILSTSRFKFIKIASISFELYSLKCSGRGDLLLISSDFHTLSPINRLYLLTIYFSGEKICLMVLFGTVIIILQVCFVTLIISFNASIGFIKCSKISLHITISKLSERKGSFSASLTIKKKGAPVSFTKKNCFFHKWKSNVDT